MSRRIDDMIPSAAECARELMESLYDERIPAIIVETRRPVEVQAAYYAQGREPLAAVNAKRHRAGLAPIGEAENGRIVTKTLDSLHIIGRAIDICPMDSKGRIVWTVTKDNAALWLSIGAIGERCGFEWGGRWAPLVHGIGWDAPHYQYTGA